MERAVARAEAERWIEVAGKLLEARDLLGSRRFAKRAQETDPQVDGVDQMIAIIDVLLAAEKRINNHLDWYAILQLDRRSNDLELIKRQFRKLALLLHPDKNKYPFSDNAFKLVCDAWAFLSDSSKKSLYDNEFNMFMRFDPIVLKNQAAVAVASASPVRRSVREKRKSAKAVAAEAAPAEEEAVVTEAETETRLSTFWTICPYCYHLYEYPRVYKDCCLRCQNCRRGFHGAVVATPPPPAVGPGKDLYYCCWAFFPIGLTKPGNLGKDVKWTPFGEMFSQAGGDDLVDGGGGKKAKTDNVEKTVSKQGSQFKNAAEDGNVGNRGVQDGAEEQPKAVRIKTTARKSVKPKPIGQTVGGKWAPEWIGMDLNLELKADGEELKKAGAVEGIEIGSIDKEATEGIGFFEGLDDILGNLPLLSVPGAQKAAESAS